jgi:hypothetical protein
MTKGMSQKRCWLWFFRYPGTTSPKLYVLSDRFSGGQRDIRGRRRPGLIEE